MGGKLGGLPQHPFGAFFILFLKWVQYFSGQISCLLQEQKHIFTHPADQSSVAHPAAGRDIYCMSFCSL